MISEWRRAPPVPAAPALSLSLSQLRTLLLSLVESEGFSPRAYADKNFEWFASRDYQANGGYLDGSTKARVVAAHLPAMGFRRSLARPLAWLGERPSDAADISRRAS